MYLYQPDNTSTVKEAVAVIVNHLKTQHPNWDIRLQEVKASQFVNGGWTIGGYKEGQYISSVSISKYLRLESPDIPSVQANLVYFIEKMTEAETAKYVTSQDYVDILLNKKEGVS